MAERQQEELNMVRKTSLTYLMELALLVGILLMMNITGLAMIPLPGQYASIMTVPVAVGAMMLGPLAGGVLGGVMGCISFYTAIKTGFSTLFLAGYTGGVVVVLSFVNSIIPRVLMGVCVGWVYRAARRLDRGNTISYYIGGLAAPVLNTELVSVLKNALTVPLVLHGASGLSEEAVRECIRRGICKVNFATELRMAYTEGVRETLRADPQVFDPKAYGKAGREKVKELVKGRMLVCGCDGKA